jgi:hypothetical protein
MAELLLGIDIGNYRSMCSGETQDARGSKAIQPNPAAGQVYRLHNRYYLELHERTKDTRRHLAGW